MDYENRVAEMHGQWQICINELSVLFAKAEKYYKDYLAVFQGQESQINKQVLVTSCLWLSESRYLLTIIFLQSLLNSASGISKSMWETLQQIEIQRVQSVKSSIDSFIELHDKIFKQNIEEVSILLNEVPLDVLEISSILGEDDKKVLENDFGSPDVFQALATWKLPSPPRSNLVVKSGSIERETGVFKVWKTSYAVLTVDRFLHIFEGDVSQIFQEPINSCFLSKANIIENEELYFEIIEAKAIGLLSKLSAPRRSVFKLNSLQEYLEWVTILRRLT